ncbi:MAG: hypothetical protein LBB83_02930 [Treponema sp.]|jgi:hypothetical protein|nr:hypothetical protein [Treponema sp.]
MKKRELRKHFFAVVFCWILISGCMSSPEPEPETNIPLIEPGVYSNQLTTEELYLSEPVDMSGICAFLGTDKTGTYIIIKSVYTDSYTITFKWSDSSTTSAFISNGDKKALRFGTDSLWSWMRYQR